MPASQPNKLAALSVKRPYFRWPVRCSNNCESLASSLTAKRRNKQVQGSANFAARLTALQDCRALWQSRTALR